MDVSDENPYKAPGTIPQAEPEEEVPEVNTPDRERGEILKFFIASVGMLVLGYSSYQINHDPQPGFAFGLLGVVGLVVVAALVIHQWRS